MTFEEALKVKLSYPNPYLEMNEYYRAIIVPELSSDKRNYLSILKSQEYSEVTLKNNCSNGSFKVEGFKLGTYFD